MKNSSRNAITVLAAGLYLLINAGSSLGYAPICQKLGGHQALFNKLSGDRLLKEGKFPDSIKEYEKSLTLNPQSTTTCFNLAIAFYAIRNIKGAATALERLLSINPYDVEAQYNLACLKLYQQDIASAKTHFKRALLCCDKDPLFKPLIHRALDFLDDLKKLEPSPQELIFFFLQKGLPPLALATAQETVA